MSCEIFAFPAPGTSRARPRRQRRAAAVQAKPVQTEPELTVTAANGRLREQRREIWQEAHVATGYWRARLDLNSAIWWAQRTETEEGRSHPAINDREDRQPLVEKWRAAFVKQLLTPAWNAAGVAWKQNALARGKYQYTGLTPERLKHAISEDLAFLAAHPVRQSKRKAATPPSEGGAA